MSILRSIFHSMDNQGILAWIEIDVSSCINECFSDIEAVASFIEASRQDFDAMNMTIHSAVARKPKDRESRKVSLVLMMTLITIMIVFAVIFTVLDRSSRKRKVIEGAPVWIPPKEFEIEKQGEINGEKPGLFPKFALKSSKRQRMDSAEINLLEKSLASKLPRLPTLPRRKKLQPLPSQLHIESASEHPVSFPLTAEEANRRGPYGRTALMLLAKNTLRSEEQVVDDVTKLHAAGADVNLCDDYDDTALHMAVSAGRVALVRKLLHLGASPVIRDRTNSTCLHLAARACKCDMMAALLENEEMRKEVDAVDDSNRTALMLVAMHDRVDAEAAQMLLDAGADVNYAGDNTLNSWNGRTALHFAAKYDNSQMVAFLVRKLALINSKDYENCTPLHLAAAEGHVGPVMELIRAGASVLMRNDKFQTPYDVAFLNSCHGVARLLGSGDNNRVQLYSNNGEIIACSSSPKRKNTKVLTKKSTEEIQGCISCEPAGLTFSPYNHLTEASSMSICGATFSSPQSSNTLAGRMASSNSAPQCGPPAQHSTPYVQLLENGGAPVNGEISSPHCEGLKRRFALSEGSMEESSECIDSGFHTLSNGSQYDHGASYPSFSGFFNPDHSVNAPVP
ncbi:hypothetical protein KIN20_032786 [Parelaphostrongylus tenuis]|uniref:Uncharacterized protein n=1 Tax=Parelaphostrongylus tenuis TaxID=148309 RepID=A0AAD5R6Y4_PARTN|nr:hypothetical protein KIN20_032786 [Parelaphostrongylus tenuis]